MRGASETSGAFLYVATRVLLAPGRSRRPSPLLFILSVESQTVTVSRVCIAI